MEAVQATERSVSPPITALDSLQPPLTEGERRVFDFFHDHLPLEWEIYLQPYLNGLKPDIVLLNQNVGIAVFEVKDWNLDDGIYSIDDGDTGPPRVVINSTGERKRSPVEQVRLYEREIRDLYCPRLGAQGGVPAISSGVIIPTANTEQARQFLQPCVDEHGIADSNKEPYYPIAGGDALDAGNLLTAFPEAKRSSSMYMTPELAADFRNWLVEPHAQESKRTLPKLTERQKELISTRTDSGYRRIKGPAGCGKSLVVAARAAQLKSEGKEVLVVSFNITLLNFLKHQARRWGKPEDRGGITYLNFHQWAKRTIAGTAGSTVYGEIWQGLRDGEQDETRDETLATVVMECLEDHDDLGRYDAVIVDEGQDFRPDWWNCLRMVCTDGGEMLLVADATQDLYGRSNRWTDEAMAGAGFPGGRWVQMEECFRLPPAGIELARRFADEYMTKAERDLPEMLQTELDVYPSTIRWRHAAEAELPAACLDELREMISHVDAEDLAVTDVIFLAADNALGRDVVGHLRNQGVTVHSTFSEIRNVARSEKFAFYLDSCKVKATTVHSFKGFESRAMVVAVKDTKHPHERAAIYVALTRLLRHSKGSFLTVVSSDTELVDFGSAIAAR